MYINENEATVDIEAYIKKYTQDFKLYAVKRKTINTKKFSLFCIVKVTYAQGQSSLFSDFIKDSINDDIELVESDVVEESRTLKEVFLFKCTISVFGI